jgi:hypothetical protein
MSVMGRIGTQLGHCADGERIKREIEEHRALSQQVMQLTKTISESVEKVFVLPQLTR